jgi:hypothetical protein
MAILVEQPALARPDHSASGVGAEIGARISHALDVLGPFGRRFALTGLGAVVALCCGVATASAFRLPSEVTDPAQAQEQTVAQSELPSEAAARAYALENPPTYMAAAPKDADDPTRPNASPSLAALHDDEPTTATYTTPTDDQPAGDADHRSAATPAPASNAPVAADTEAAAG